MSMLADGATGADPANLTQTGHSQAGNSQTGRKRGGFVKLYSIVWLLMGSGALFYLTAAVTWTDLAARFDNNAGDLQQQNNKAKRAVANLQARLRQATALRTADQATSQRLRRALQAARAQSAKLTKQVALLRARVAPQPAAAQAVSPTGTNSIPVLNAAPGQTPNPNAGQTGGQIQNVVAPAVQPALQPKPAVQRGSGPPLPPRRPAGGITPTVISTVTTRIATGSIVRAPKSQERAPSAVQPSVAAAQTGAISLGTPVVTAARQSGATPPATTPQGGIALKFSSGPSLSSVKLNWNVLQDRHAATLQGLSPRYRTTTAGANGVSAFELVAGPVSSREEADQLCRLLRLDNVQCSISTFVGRPLR